MASPPEESSDLERYTSDEDDFQEHMDKSLSNLQADLIYLYSKIDNTLDDMPLHEKRQRTKRKIEKIFSDFVKQISENKSPVLVLRNSKSWNNCVFNKKLSLKEIHECTHKKIKLNNKNSLYKFSLIYFVLGKIYKLLCSNEVCTKRELYYQNIELIYDQNLLDHVLYDISNLLNCPFYELNICSTSKGVIVGPIKIITTDNEINCNFNENELQKGTLIPNDINNIKSLQSDAKFVLLIEKDAIFEKLIDTGIIKKLPTCILITGKGMPDMNTRALLKKIWDILSIPILAFVDPDPYGIEIMCVYRFGSLSLSHQSDLLAVPSIRWLGPYPSETLKLCDSPLPLDKNDRAKLSDLLKRPYMIDNDIIKFEINFMLTKGTKTEIEALEIYPCYLSSVYIPHKLITSIFI